jgi:fructose-bisphosphate aldolase class I
MSVGKVFEAQRSRVQTRDGAFIAALDQSGGSTPKALRLYGIGDDAYSGDDEMFAKMHEMRSRIITSPSFDKKRILAAILFENTMNRTIEGQGSAQYLWAVKGIVPILKVDKGLQDVANGVQLMKPMPNLDALLAAANQNDVFGTKMRSVIKDADAAGIDAIADQQFEIGAQILAAGLVPILEPEVDIHSPSKSEAEGMLKRALLTRLEQLKPEQQIMLKLTLPNEDNFYKELIEHPKVLRVVALSGGYPRDDATARLARNEGMIASFSRALTEGLTAQQSDDEFNALLDRSIEAIYQASKS